MGGGVPWVRALAVLTEDSSPYPSIHVTWLKTICDDSFRRGSHALFWPYWTTNCTYVAYIQHKHIHRNKNKKYKER